MFLVPSLEQQNPNPGLVGQRADLSLGLHSPTSAVPSTLCMAFQPGCYIHTDWKTAGTPGGVNQGSSAPASWSFPLNPQNQKTEASPKPAQAPTQALPFLSSVDTTTYKHSGKKNDSLFAW